jgi:hypothetical protein
VNAWHGDCADKRACACMIVAREASARHHILMTGDWGPVNGRHARHVVPAPSTSSRAVKSRTAARARFALVAVSLLSAACVADEAQRVSVEPAPKPASVAFVLTDRTLVYGLTVATCRGRPVWTISNEQHTVQAPARIIYGVTPDGYVTRIGPNPLTPGCYEVIVSGPSRARFWIGADGQLIPDSSTRQADSVRDSSTRRADSVRTRSP